MKKILTIAALLTALTGTAFAATNYDLTIEKPAAKVNVKAVAAVKLTAKGVYRINREFPARLSLTAPDGVTLDRTKLMAADAKITEKELKFEIGLTASTAGKKTITGELRGAVCNDADCIPFTEKVSIEVGVAAQ
ncbi:hypothetical protein SAMN02745121_07564 [Nannocystis exedens]|uniref:Disulphide bond corrector protein DsbC n=1 Tax=Nannocystis exedens TaxID=54 RepID=A0A1I2GVR2_9BACT|nr:hypothetical protein [Nannocystis exedens]PCC68906.1 hypothetical protein NAEX_01927 [Nannocystis exedens]SFF22034.1 hypothetical protein SAMN02745121_07564 [Nannocystis exedens]